MSKIMVAMSGGVDSSAAAYLLSREGHEVVGITMRLEPVPGRADETDPVTSARQVCDTLGIAHHVVDYAELLRAAVIEPFLDEYLRGRTPNPCVPCNRRVKFGALLEEARRQGFDALATGHYARIEPAGDRYALHKPRDARKDQTYFLYAIPAATLPYIRFPLGNLTKEDVREIARAAGLPAAHRAESQDICFVSDGSYRHLLTGRPPCRPGSFVDTQGTPLGTHRGVSNYTIGQRKGLGIAAGRPLYVVAIDPETATVVLGDRGDLLSEGLVAHDVNLLVEQPLHRAAARIRYTHIAADAELTWDRDTLKVVFDNPQEAITPGQSVVVYDGERVIGGGVIAHSISLSGCERTEQA